MLTNSGASPLREVTRLSSSWKISMNWTKRCACLLYTAHPLYSFLTVYVHLINSDFYCKMVWWQLELMISSWQYAGGARPVVVVHSSLSTNSRNAFMAKHGQGPLADAFAGHKCKDSAFSSTAVTAPVCFCVGDIDPLTLQAAGVPTCARFVTLAPSAPASDMSSEERGALLAISEGRVDGANLTLVRCWLLG